MGVAERRPVRHGPAEPLRILLSDLRSEFAAEVAEAAVEDERVRITGMFGFGAGFMADRRSAEPRR